MKATVILAIRLVVLTVLYFICFAAVSAAVLPSPSKQPTPVEAATTLVALLAVSLLNTLVLGYIILRSRWAGWKLILAIFFVFYGVMTVMPQIETTFFITTLPPGMLPRLFLSGAIIAALFSSLAVLILGKRKSNPEESDKHLRLDISAGQWVGKLSLIVIVYVVIYFTFGYFIAWKSAAVLFISWFLVGAVSAFLILGQLCYLRYADAFVMSAGEPVFIASELRAN